MTRKKKVLVVDDERGIRFLLTQALETEGFFVREARDGLESLEILKRDAFDLVITDLNMPRLDGLSMLRNMKSTGRQEKVIVITGNPEKWVPEEDLPYIVDCLVKPFELQTLVHSVLSATA